MLLSDVQERQKYVHDTRVMLTNLTDILHRFFGGFDVIAELCQMRKYTDPRMFDLLASKQIFRMPNLSDIQIIAKSHGINLDPVALRNLGLIGDDGGYWLEQRFVIPLRNYSRQVIALVCWYPDARKYITTGTLGFTNISTFFNSESYNKAFYREDDDKTAPLKSRVFVVEGIFDALAVESLGYCCFGNEGLALSPVKKEMLSRFDRVFFIPDNDRPGSKSNKYLCSSSTHYWDTPNSALIRLTGPLKDMDDVIKTFHPENLDAFITDKDYIKVDTSYKEV